MGEVGYFLDYSLGGRVRCAVECIGMVEDVIVLLYVFKVVFYYVLGIGVHRPGCADGGVTHHRLREIVIPAREGVACARGGRLCREIALLYHLCYYRCSTISFKAYAV